MLDRDRDQRPSFAVDGFEQGFRHREVACRSPGERLA
jgi:hypothetical protein